MKKDNVKDKIIAGAGSAAVGAALKQVASVDAHSGYAHSLENYLKSIKVPDKVAYHIAGVTRRIPSAAVGTSAAVLTYDAMGGRKKSSPVSEKIQKGIIAGGISTLASLPLQSSVAKFPSEYKALSGNKKLLMLLKNRGLQSLISAPASLITYDTIRGKKKNPGTGRTLTAALGAAGVGALTTLPFAVKYEGLIPSVENKALATGAKLENANKLFRANIGSGTTLGKYIGRVYHSIGPRTLSSLLAAGGSFAAYDYIKDKLQNKK